MVVYDLDMETTTQEPTMTETIICNICGIHPSAGHEDGSPPSIGDPGECISCRGYYDDDGRFCRR